MAVETSEVRFKAQAAKNASKVLALTPVEGKNAALEAIANTLVAHTERILAANAKDLAQADERGITGALRDRLALTEERVEAMAQGVRDVAALPDPVGEVVRTWKRPNGLELSEVRVPLGVVGIIYEARPNVTADAAALCLKTGNAVVLRGGSEAIESNKAIAAAVRDGLVSAGLPADGVQLVEQTERAAAVEMMRLNGLIDVLIPRGGAGLIQAVVSQATVPVIETGAGVCHIYLAESADETKALDIVKNAKLKRPSVCNAVETLLVHEARSDDLLPKVLGALAEEGVVLKGCPRARATYAGMEASTEEDWHAEYLDLVLAVKIVDDVEEAMDHIDAYGTGHSDAIVTESYTEARRFTQRVDSAAVYVNASTYFSDGAQFGFGAEIGISTQKLHARGPMGLTELTSSKYVVLGDGHIR